VRHAQIGSFINRRNLKLPELVTGTADRWLSTRAETGSQLPVQSLEINIELRSLVRFSVLSASEALSAHFLCMAFFMSWSSRSACPPSPAVIPDTTAYHQLSGSIALWFIFCDSSSFIRCLTVLFLLLPHCLNRSSLLCGAGKTMSLIPKDAHEPDRHPNAQNLGVCHTSWQKGEVRCRWYAGR
jgi:hypothetical protein